MLWIGTSIKKSGFEKENIYVCDIAARNVVMFRADICLPLTCYIL